MNQEKKNLWSWLVYDFGNSFFITALSGLFLAQWLIIDNKLDDIWYGASFAIATVFVLITSPFLGAWSDKLGNRMFFIKWTTIGLVIFNGLMAFVAVSNISLTHRVFIVLFLSMIVQYLYQINLIFYNALLKNVSTEKNRGKISGLGEGIGSFGWLVAVLVLLPFANGVITLFNNPGRSQVFLPAFIISTILMLPLVLWFKEKKDIQAEDKEVVNNKKISQKTWQGIKELFRKNKNVGIYLLGFSLISDIVITINLYFAVVMDSIYKISDNMKSVFLGITLISTTIFAYFFGKLGDRYGYRVIILLTCLVLIIVDLLFFLASSQWVLYLVTIVGGAGVGGYYSVTKAMMVKISPPEQLGEYFGFYSTFQKFASIIAPLIWGGVVLLLKYDNVLKYRVAGLVMVVLLIIGTIVIMKTKEEKPAVQPIHI